MIDKHNQSFFSQKASIIVETNKKEEPFIFLHCIKKKNDGFWEQTSRNEGKTVKISIEEIIEMLSVLSHKKAKWTIVHDFKNEKTFISINWQKEEEIFWINIGDYREMMKSAQAEFFRLLLEHLLQEKIEYATTSNFQDNMQAVDSKSSIQESDFVQEVNNFHLNSFFLFSL